MYTSQTIQKNIHEISKMERNRSVLWSLACLQRSGRDAARRAGPSAHRLQQTERLSSTNLSTNGTNGCKLAFIVWEARILLWFITP